MKMTMIALTGWCLNGMCCPYKLQSLKWKNEIKWKLHYTCTGYQYPAYIQELLFHNMTFFVVCFSLQKLSRASSASSLSSLSTNSSSDQIPGSSTNHFSEKFKLPSSETSLPGQWKHLSLKVKFWCSFLWSAERKLPFFAIAGHSNVSYLA